VIQELSLSVSFPIIVFSIIVSAYSLINIYYCGRMTKEIPLSKINDRRLKLGIFMNHKDWLSTLARNRESR
jgi:hypothetical protein